MRILATLLLLLFGSSVMADDLIYEGTWVTTNRKLDGTMTCVATDLGKEKWKGRFYGEWQGSKFSYNVEWTGPPEKLTGKARIDGADYDWTGSITPSSPGEFKGTFTGTRYKGYFNLKQKTK
jgi:hypothetical protein